jgi:hypothetical protein
MGILKYPVRGSLAIEIDDRTLAHLQVVFGAKLRLGQPFFFSWVDGVASGGGRASVWIDSTIPLTFVYDKNRKQEINRPWLEALMAGANSTDGLLLCAEPEALRLVDDADEPDRVAA